MLPPTSRNQKSFAPALWVPGCSCLSSWTPRALRNFHEVRNKPLCPQTIDILLFNPSYQHAVNSSAGCPCWGDTLCSPLRGLDFRLMTFTVTPSQQKNWVQKLERLTPACILYTMLHFKVSYRTGLMYYSQKPLIVHWAHWAINGFYEGVSKWTKCTIFDQGILI